MKPGPGLFIALLLLTPLLAAQQGPLVGELAPRFVAESCVNPPEVIDSEKLLGEVIWLEFWGTT